MSFSVFDLLREADGDEGQAPANPDAGTDAPADTPADNAGGDDAGDDNGGDDNFDIDANLDNPDDEGGDDNGDEPADGGDDLGGGDDMGGGGNEEATDEEPVESNTDIFASLTAEEQKIKIIELKNQFGNLYSACDDILDKINSLDVDEDSIEFTSRITNSIFNLKKYISDYLTYTFAQKSFIENDIMFNRFLSIIKSISVTFDKFVSIVTRERENNQNNIQK